MSSRYWVAVLIFASSVFHWSAAGAQSPTRAGLDNARADLSVAKQELKQISAEIDAKKIERANVARDLERAQREVATVRSELTELEAEIKHARKAVLELCQNKDAQKTNRCSHDDPEEFRRRNRRTLALLEEKSSSGGKLEKAVARVRAFSRNIERIEKDQALLESSHKSANLLVSALEQTIDNLEKIERTRWRPGQWQKDKRWVNVGRLCAVFYSCEADAKAGGSSKPTVLVSQSVPDIEKSKPELVQVRGTCPAGGDKTNVCRQCVTKVPRIDCKWRYTE